MSFGIGFCREINNRDAQPIIIQADDLCQLRTAVFRHAYVHQHHIWAERVHFFQQQVGFGIDIHQHAGVAEDQFVACCQVGIVIHNQDPEWTALMGVEAALQATFQRWQVDRFGEVAARTSAHSLQPTDKAVLRADNQ